MNKAEFITHREEFIKRRSEILGLKGHAYSGDTNPFANFERNAEKVGLTKYQVWLVYFQKHIDAIVQGIKDNPEYPIDKSEGLMGRIDDAVNYLDLLQGMVVNDSLTVKIPNLTIEELTKEIVNLMGGNGLSTNESMDRIKVLLKENIMNP